MRSGMVFWLVSFQPCYGSLLSSYVPLTDKQQKGTVKDQFQHGMMSRLLTFHSFSEVFLWTWGITSPSEKPIMPFLVPLDYNQFPPKEISKDVFKMCRLLRKYSSLGSSELRDTLNFFFFKQNSFSLADMHVAQTWSRTEKLWFSPPKWLHERHLLLAKRGSHVAVFIMG